MLEDFSLRGIGRQSSGGFLALARDGYEIVLSPDQAAVTNYSTVHRERTWSQFKAGVRSRFGKVPRNDPPPAESDPILEPLDQILALIDSDAVYLTASAFSRGAKMMEDAGEEGEVENFLRRTLRDDIAAGPGVERSDNGAHLIHAKTRTWILRADLLMVLGVRPV